MRAGAASRHLMVALRSVMLSAMLAPRVVVFGPGSLDMRLLTAKLAARAGLDTSLFVGGTTLCRKRGLYGRLARARKVIGRGMIWRREQPPERQLAEGPAPAPGTALQPASRILHQAARSSSCGSRCTTRSI